jgi:hypothetical protein
MTGPAKDAYHAYQYGTAPFEGLSMREQNAWSAVVQHAKERQRVRCTPRNQTALR